MGFFWSFLVQKLVLYWSYCCAFVTAVDQSFERMGFGMSHNSSGYNTYMPQQMSAQSGVSMNQYSTAVPTATYPSGSYVSSHHHQVALQVFCSRNWSVVLQIDFQILQS